MLSEGKSEVNVNPFLFVGWSPWGPSFPLLLSADMTAVWFSQLSHNLFKSEKNLPLILFSLRIKTWILLWNLVLIFDVCASCVPFCLSSRSKPMCPPAIRWRPPVPTPTAAVTAVAEEGNSWVKLTCTFVASIREPRIKTLSSFASRESI